MLICYGKIELLLRIDKGEFTEPDKKRECLQLPLSYEVLEQYLDLESNLTQPSSFQLQFTRFRKIAVWQLKTFYSPRMVI